ncbi:MAG: hypothetical protein JW847_01915 [Candidatus Omnitrophica bacterium]|nr:hypothetical protein [Candidatus Omnitrophota bacterium]
MIKNLSLAAILLVLCVTPTHAARTMEKVYKISVTLPASVAMPNINTAVKISAASRDNWWQTTEQMVIDGHDQKTLLRTTVVK